MRELAQTVGRTGIETIRKLGGMGYLLVDAFRWAFVGPWQGYRFRWQARRVSARKEGEICSMSVKS